MYQDLSPGLLGRKRIHARPRSRELVAIAFPLVSECPWNVPYAPQVACGTDSTAAPGQSLVDASNKCWVGFVADAHQEPHGRERSPNGWRWVTHRCKGRRHEQRAGCRY